MIKHNQDGTVGVTGLAALVMTTLFVLTLIVAIWAYSGRQDYKNNVDTKIATAVTVAKQQEDTAKDTQFAEASKQPLISYSGPETTGSIVVKYPRTWSAYVDTTGSSSSSNSGAALAAYFNPSVVPSVSDDSSVFALQVQVLDQSYSDTLNALDNSGGNDSTPLVSTAYALPKVPKAVGVKVTGPMPDNKDGTMVVLPLRDQTIEVWTDGNQYLNDFNNFILPNFTFSP